MRLSREEEASARAFLADLSRQAERQRLAMSTREAYRWGRIDRRTQAFQPPARSADAAIYESQDLMHRRVRSEVENNPLIKRISEALTDLVIGEQMQLLADPLDATMDLEDLVSSEEFDDNLRWALEADEKYSEWFLDKNLVDVERKHAGPELQRLAFSECVATGDAFLLRTMVKRGAREVPLAYQLIEKEQLDCSKDRPAAPGVNKIINGIELDRLNREVAFWVHDAHPYDDFSSTGAAYGKSTRIPAERMIHLCLFRRPSQSIGVSWLHAVGQATFDRDKLIGSELQTAVKQALLALVWKLKHRPPGERGLGLDDGLDAYDEFGNQEVKLGSSPHAVVIGPEDELKLVESNRPGANFDEFINAVDHDLAAGAGISFYSLTGRYDQTNFSSLRGALLAEQAHIVPIQGWYARNFAIPIRREYNRTAAAMGLFESVTADEFYANERYYQRLEALGAGRELLDPEAETDAALGRLRGGLSTLKIECSKRGLHWIRVLRQAALENRVAEKLGVVLDFSKGQGGQVEKTTRERGDQPPQSTRKQKRTR